MKNIDTKIKMTALKGYVNFKSHSKKLVTLGENGYKNENEKMTEDEQKLFNTFENTVQKYVFLNGLNEYDFTNSDDLKEARIYLIKSAMYDCDDNNKIKERILLIDEFLSNKTGDTYETLYNSTKNKAVLFEPEKKKNKVKTLSK